jgi:opacity protein-like surface antigen
MTKPMNPKRVALIGLAALGIGQIGPIATGAAWAADTFYLRAAGGMANTDRLSTLSSNPGDVLSGKADKTGVFDLGLGYVPSTRIPLIGLRTEATVSIRPDLKFVTNAAAGGRTSTTDLTGQQYTATGNLFVDFASLPVVTPYLGAGAGFAHTELANSQTNFAWNVMLGATAKLLPMTSLDLMLRHVDSGQLKGRTLTANGSSTLNYSSNSTNNEVLLGVKFGF